MCETKKFGTSTRGCLPKTHVETKDTSREGTVFDESEPVAADNLVRIQRDDRSFEGLAILVELLAIIWLSVAHLWVSRVEAQGFA